MAIKAYRAGKIPFPEGAIIGRIARSSLIFRGRDPHGFLLLHGPALRIHRRAELMIFANP